MEEFSTARHGVLVHLRVLDPFERTLYDISFADGVDHSVLNDSVKAGVEYANKGWLQLLGPGVVAWECVGAIRIETTI